MSDLSWFSAKLRFVIMVEPEGADGYMDSLYIFRARDFGEAFQRAIDIGRRYEHEYLNTYGQQVRWRFKEVVTLDIIMSESLDGAEVSSQFIALPHGESIPFDAELHPEKSEPGQTI